MTFLEFFAGGGMAGLGLRPGFRCTFANDMDAKKAASYRANSDGAPIRICDIADLKASDIPGHPSLIWGSPPCVGASLAGGRKGLGAEAWKFLDLVQALRDEDRAASLVVIENVPDMLTSDNGSDFDRICNTLDKAGYRIGAMVIDAAKFLPQSRERLFLVAVDKAIDIPAAIVADGPSEPFHTKGLVKAFCQQQLRPIWFNLPVPAPHGVIISDIIDKRSAKWNAPEKTAEIIGKMDGDHIARLAEDKRAGQLVVRALNWRTRKAKGGPSGKLAPT